MLPKLIYVPKLPGNLIKTKNLLRRSGVGLGLGSSKFPDESKAAGLQATLRATRFWSITGHTFECAGFSPVVSEVCQGFRNIHTTGTVYQPLSYPTQSPPVQGSQELVRVGVNVKP